MVKIFKICFTKILWRPISHLAIPHRTPTAIGIPTENPPRQRFLNRIGRNSILEFGPHGDIVLVETDKLCRPFSGPISN